ncbi:MAG: PHB depolymerase family esterase [Sandaracinaceae bacterium]
MRVRQCLALATLLALTGCDDTEPVTDAGTDAGAPPMAPSTVGPADRPADLQAPLAYDGTTPLPAVILLHGFGASGDAQATYLGIKQAARREGFYLVTPDGTEGTDGRRFWNATPGCCDFGNLGVDDVAYVEALIDALSAAVPVADGQVYMMGHSNGGFMSYRFACERSDRVAAIVSLAGSDFIGETDCEPTEPVAVLQIHGDQDATIQYGGTAGFHPSAPDVVARWAARNGCGETAGMGEPRDLEAALAGDESEVLIYPGCTEDVELWTIVGGSHIPAPSRDFAVQVLDWMRAHAD